MIQLENRWADLDEIWYGPYVTGICPEIFFFQFPTVHNINKADEGTCEVVSTLVQFITGAYDLTKVRSHDPLRTIL
jgi:hypothetical protein